MPLGLGHYHLAHILPSYVFVAAQVDEALPAVSDIDDRTAKEVLRFTSDERLVAVEDVQDERWQLAKLALGLPTDGKLLLSAGLLRDGKGLETIVSAMPATAGLQPSLRLLVAGETHPAYLEATGVRYDTKL